MSSYPPKGDEPDLIRVQVTAPQLQLMRELDAALHNNQVKKALELLEQLKRTLQENV